MNIRQYFGLWIFLLSLNRQRRSIRKTQQREEACQHIEFGSACMLLHDLILEFFQKKFIEALPYPQGKFHLLCWIFHFLPSNYTYTTKEIIVENTPNLERKKNIICQPPKRNFLPFFPSLLFSTGNTGSTVYSCSQGLTHESLTTSLYCHFP